MASPQGHRGWILPGLPPVFTVRDYYQRSLRETPHIRAYLNYLVKQGRLIKVDDDVYAKLGTHVCFVTFQGVDRYTWGKADDTATPRKRGQDRLSA